MNEHIDDLAELYALGALDKTEMRDVEIHIEGCAACADRLIQAQESIAAIEVLQDRFDPPPALGARLQRSLDAGAPRAAVYRSTSMRGWPAVALALAAAVALFLVPFSLLMKQNTTMHSALSQDDTAFAQLLGSGFRGASFQARPQDQVQAKVLYAPGGQWYYVIIMHPKPGTQVAYVHDGKMEMLGECAMRGHTGTLFMVVHHKMPELAILQSGEVIADAHLAF
ncbi:MAG: zf-HC2 domain-containing protein [Candidatus Eremiobacteraeota bacterium]|nr:zf-HC2 domain-containing protein [Candidatus Eremiobacteraeota bacterium]